MIRIYYGREPGGEFQSLDALLLAYLLPVPLIILIARRLDAIGWARARPVALLLALALLFAYVTLETKRIFQGMMLVPESLSLAETYAYSAVWLGFALVLFVTGMNNIRDVIPFPRTTKNAEF